MYLFYYRLSVYSEVHFVFILGRLGLKSFTNFLETKISLFRGTLATVYYIILKAQK